MQLSAQIDTGIGIFPHDSCFLETPCPLVFLEDSTRGIWEIGQPNKAPFNASYSPVNALVTDTINPYSINENSFFEIKLPNYNGLSSVISFWHKIDSDSAKDGGYIEVSHDHGQTWKNVIEEAIFQNLSPFIEKTCMKKQILCTMESQAFQDQKIGKK